MELISFLSIKIESIAIIISNFIIYFLPFLDTQLSQNPETIMIVIGFGGQALFGARFLIQWVKSENEKKSVIPIAFWYLSIVGGIGLLTYAIFRKDPVIITGQVFGIFIYLRNLILIYKKKSK